MSALPDDPAPVARPAAGGAPRGPRILKGLLLAVLVLILLLVAAATWLFTTSQGTRFVVERAAKLAGEGVTIEGADGRIGGRMTFDRIEVSRPDIYVRIEGVEIDSSPLAALGGTLTVHKLAARSVEVRTRDTQAAARIPESFAPPYGIRLEDGVVGELRKGVLTPEAAAERDPARKRALMDASRDEDLVVRDIRLRGAADAKQITVDAASADTAYGRGRLSGRLATGAPFAIDMKAAFEGRVAERDYRADVAATGSLQALELAIDGALSGQPAKVKARLAPFTNFPLRALEAQATGVDLAKQAGGPATSLDIDIRLTGAEQANAFAGPVRIDNRAPGRWDQQRVPVTSAAGRVVVTQERLDIADLQLALAGGGSARGRATVLQSGVEAELAVADVDLAALHGSLQKTRITGRLAASGDRAAQRFEAALRDPRFVVEGRGGIANQRLDLETVRIATGGGAVNAKGGMALAGTRDFRFEGRAEHFDPSAFVKTTRGDLNFAFVATGRLGDAFAGELRADVAPSTYAGLPASGRVNVAGDAKRIADADVDVTLGDARLTARGAFGRTGDAMDVTFRVPSLATVGKPFGLAIAGRTEGEARLTGTFQSPAGRVALTGANLALPSNVSVREIALRAEAGVAPDSPIDLAVNARGIALGAESPPTPFAESIVAALKGTRAQHRLEVDARMTRDIAARVALAGGLDERAKEPAWSGRIENVSMTGPGAFAMQRPATLYASAARVEVGDARLQGEWGEAHFETTRWTPRTLDLKGSSPRIVIRNLARSLRLGTVPRSDLEVALDWDVHGAEHLDGRVNLRRIGGDLRVGEPPLPLGLTELEISAEVVRGRAQARVRVAGERAGRIDGTGTALIVRGKSGWEPATGAPVQARIVAEHGNLELLSPWLGVDARLGGRLNADVRVTGTGESPQVAGEARLVDLVVREPQTGFEVERGEVALRMAGRSVTIERFTATTPWRPVAAAREKFAGMTIPQQGTISAEGAIDLGSRTGALKLRADHAVLTQLTSRFVAVSGEATLEAKAGGMQATGAFKADAAWVGALDTPLPSISEDVVVVRAAKPPEEPKPRDANPIRVDLRFSLGDQVHFEGRGLDTRLAGDIRLTGTVGSDLRATGTIRTRGGTYKGYGQNLAIERGVLVFSGPLDNPSLNVLAVRKGLAVEPGVEVLGSASRPRIRLVSTPDVPEPEKLSWLVLGRGPSELAPGDASVLLAAATSMLGGNNPGSDLGKKFGLDEVKIGRADTNSILGVLPQSTVAGKTGSPSAAEVVSVGKRITRDVHLTYEQGLADAEGALKVAWRITRHFQLLVRAGFLPGVDAVYRWTFR